MTDWWSTSAPKRSDEPVQPEPVIGWDPEPPPPAPAHPPIQSVPEEEPEPQRPDRRKSLLIGAAGAAVAGALVFAVMPHDGSTPADAPGAPSATSQESFPPAAGGGPAKGASDRAEASSAPDPKVVTLSAAPSGSGSVGAIVKITIVNNTDEAVVVMSSMVKGDGRSAVIGEGTLAPGSRKVEPGETATGTVEFTSKKAPIQVALLDLGGNVVAASE